MLKRISLRLPGARSRHEVSQTRCEDSTAEFTSATSAAATSTKVSSVAGLISGVRRPEAAFRQLPSTNIWWGIVIELPDKASENPRA